MLNAKDATEPRQVEIGLPMSYTAVSVDGVPAVYYYWPNTTSNHWRGEQLLAKQGLQNISTTAIRFGEIGYGVDSYMERGGEQFKGKLKYQTNTYGAQNFDLNVSGKLARKTYYTLSAYQNFDPGSFDLKFTNYIDRAQFYTAGITHLFNQDKGRFSVFYKYNVTHPLTTSANYAPFTYDGDGKVSEVKGFRMGRDSYLPVDGMMQYRDVKTGELVTNNLYDIVKAKTHEATALLDYDFSSTLSLALKAKVSTSKGHGADQLTMGFYEDADATYADTGEKYHGNIQRRLAQINAFTVTDAMFIAEMTKKTDAHKWVFGLNELYSYIDYARSTTQYYHEVAPNPRKLIYNGQEYANLNGSTEYDHGTENKLAAYVSDTWKVTPSFRMNYGLRLEMFSLGVDYIPNSRFSDFYLGAKYKDADGNITAVHCEYDKTQKTGQETRKVKGTIHWVYAGDCFDATVRLYENLVDEEKGKLSADGTLNLNPNSLTVLEGCKLEPALKDAKAYDSFQFVRNGFFNVDCRDSKEGAPVFNRIVGLKSSFKLNK